MKTVELRLHNFGSVKDVGKPRSGIYAFVDGQRCGTRAARDRPYPCTGGCTRHV